MTPRWRTAAPAGAAGADRGVLLEAHDLARVDLPGGSGPGQCRASLAGLRGARIPRRAGSPVGSLRVGGPYADRAGAARDHESAELDPVRDAAARRAHSGEHAALVLGADSLAGRGLLLRAVPRSGRGLRGVAVGRLHLRPRGLRGAHRLAAASDGAIWVPLVLLFFARAARGQAAMQRALGGAALGMAFLGAHHVVPTFTAVLLGAMWLVYVALGGTGGGGHAVGVTRRSSSRCGCW